MEQEVGWKPQPGTQSRFLASQVFDLGFGGAWGGTKTESLIVGGTRFANHPKMRSLILRRTFPELREIMDRTHALFPQMKATWIASEKRWEFPAGGTYEFGYCSTYEEAQQYLTAQYCVARGTPVLLADGSYCAIEAISPGQLVQTAEGPRTVLETHRVGRKPCVVAVTFDGYTLRAQTHPETHPVLLASGEWGSYASLTGAGTEDAVSCGDSQEGRLPVSWCGLVTLHGLDPLKNSALSDQPSESGGFVSSSRLWHQIYQERLGRASLDRLRIVGPEQSFLDSISLSESFDAPSDQERVQDSPDGCRPEPRLDGEPLLCRRGSVQAPSLGLGGGVKASPSCSMLDVLVRMLERTHQVSSGYEHPYTGEIRHRTEPAVVGSCVMFRVGEAEVYDLTVDEVNHYITDCQLFNKNTYIAYDQVEQLREERIWSLLVGRIRSLYSSTSCTHPGATSVNDCGRCIALMARCSFNPGGVGHGWVKRRYVSLPWDGTPVTDEHGNQRAFLFSQLADNPLLLEKDPDYARRLKSMPDILRRQAEGDWSAGEGVAFSELTESSHNVPIVDKIDRNWFLFGSFDWGFGHKWAFHLYAVRPDGVILVVDSVMGRGHIPEAIVDRVADLLEHYELRFTDLAYTVSGSDVKIQDKARGNWGPSVVEQFAAHNWFLINADQSRISGYQNTLAYIHDRKVLFCRTPGNAKGVAQMVDLATDPDSPNDVLKNDYNPETDTGGDDWYDSLRYGLMSRPLTPKTSKAVSDRINQERIFAKAQEQEKGPSPLAKVAPGFSTKDRIEKVV